MTQAFKRNYLQHALAVSEWIERHGARGGIDARSQVMEITCSGRTVRFYPQFVIANPDGGEGFAQRMLLNVSGFVGWRPDQGKQWPAARDKLEFKALAQAHGIRTPTWTQQPSEGRGTMLVKSRRSTFGRGQRGPFDLRRVDPASLKVAQGEYLEQFVVGKLLKAWFWDDALAAVELVDMPTVVGDGSSTFGQLVAHQLGAGSELPPGLAELADVQGLGVDSTLPQGVRVLADYRYMSALNPAANADFNMRDKLRATQLEGLLQLAARPVWEQLPAAERMHTVFTLDGIVDQDEQLWLLEANCNPALHPAVYDSMLDSLFRGATLAKSRSN